MKRRIKNFYIDTELVLPMYNAHPYFSLKNLGKKCALYTANTGNFYTSLAALVIFHLFDSSRLSVEGYLGQS